MFFVRLCVAGDGMGAAAPLCRYALGVASRLVARAPRRESVRGRIVLLPDGSYHPHLLPLPARVSTTKCPHRGRNKRCARSN